MKSAGIYVIKNLKDNKVYIGQSRDVERRIYDHKRCLKKKTHYNKYLQRAYDKHGENNFEFSVLCYCEPSELDEKEKCFISEYQSTNPLYGYNLEGGGNFGKEVSEAVREAKRGAKNPMYGKKISEAHKQALRIKNRANSKLFDEKQVADIKRRLAEGERVGAISDSLGVKIATISKIAHLKNWQWVAPEYNEAILNRDKTRVDKIKELEKAGVPRVQIAKMLNCSSITIQNLLGNKKDELKARDRLIIEDFKRGLSKKEIMQKYEISSCVYVRVTSEAFNEKKAQTKQKAIEMRKQGMKVKEIAEILGLHRTTVTEYTLNQSS